MAEKLLVTNLISLLEAAYHYKQWHLSNTNTELEKHKQNSFITLNTQNVKKWLYKYK